MNKLKCKIQLLEREIDSNRQLLQANEILLKEKMQSPAVIAVAMVGAFSLGCVISNKFDSGKIKEHISNTPRLLNKLYENIKIFLPLIPI
jgi:hypothetical protein